jgi:hypothetical protein
MTITYLQWYVALWATLVAFMIFPANRACQIAILFFYLLAIGTTPALIVLLPIWGVRLWYTQTRSQRAGILTVILTQLVVSLFVVQTNVHLANFLKNPGAIVRELVRGFSYKVVALSLLGDQRTDWLFANWGWLSLYVVTLIILVLVIWAIGRQPVGVQHGASLLLLYFIGAAFALYMLRLPLFGLIFEKGITKQAARYFFLSNAALILLLFVVFGSGLHPSISIKWTTSMTGLCGGLLLLVHLPTFYAGPWGEAHWTTYAALLETVKPQQRHPPVYSFKTIRAGAPTVYTWPQSPNAVYLPTIYGEPASPKRIGGTSVLIPIRPPGWLIQLYIPNGAQVYHFVEGPILLGMTYRLQPNQIAVRLVWHGSAWSDGTYQQHYTAYVHLVNQNGERVSGYDTVLDSSTNHMNSSFFFTDHSLDLPPTIAAGEYHLEIGLYHWEHDKLIEGGAVELDPPFELSQHS